ncbi:hypothetical protein BN1708_014199, partial [Verticillium longisporum]
PAPGAGPTPTTTHPTPPHTYLSTVAPALTHNCSPTDCTFLNLAPFLPPRPLLPDPQVKSPRAIPMAGTTLGKRTRDVADTGTLDCPAKRTRRSARLAEANDENADPKATESLSEIDEDHDAVPTPSTKRQYRTKSQKLTKAVPVTPQTPRHRDAFAKAPITPRHAVMSAGKLFRRMTPQTPLTPAAQQTVYHHARQLFARGADPGQLVGREEEKARLSKFVDQCSSSAPSGCLYISGPPGTGKSAMVKEVTSKLTETLGVRQAYINCMSIQSSKDLYNTLLDLLGHSEDLNEAQAMAVLQTIFVNSEEDAPVHLVVLDEIDHILTMGLESLYRLFEWSLQKPCVGEKEMEQMTDGVGAGILKSIISGEALD